MVVVTDPNTIETVFRKAMENGGRQPLTELAEMVGDAHGLPPTIATDDYEKWKRTRPLANVLLQPTLVNQLAPRISTLASDWSTKLKEVAEKQPDGSYVVPQLRSFINLFTLETIVAVTQGKRLGLTVPGNVPTEDLKKFISSVEKTIAMVAESISTFPMFKYFKTPFYREFEKAFLYVNEFSRKIRFNKLGHDVTLISDGKSSLSDAYTALGKKNGLTETEIMQVDIDSALAGVDTTSGVLTVMFYELALNPSYQEEIYKEICSVMGLEAEKPLDALPPIENNQLKKMTFLKNFVKDMIRKSPIAPMNTRLIFEDVELNGYQVPKNTNLLLFNYGVNRDEKYFENPLQVDPHRFDNEEKESKVNEYSMLLFGLGERACPGKRIAMAEVYLMAANVVYQYKLKTNAKDYVMVGSGLIGPEITKENAIQFIPRK